MPLLDAAAQTALQEGGRLGLDGFEVLIKGGRSLSIKAFDGKVDEFSTSDTCGLSVRALRAQQEGYAYTEDLRPAAVRAAVQAAAENALLVADPQPVRLAVFEGEPQQLELFCPALEARPAAEKIALALQTDAATRASPEVLAVPHVGYSEGTAFLRLLNDRGLDRGYRVSAAFIYSYPLVGRAEQRKTAFEFERSRDGAHLDPERVANAAVERARSLLAAEEVSSGSYPIVFENRSATKMLEAFAPIFNAQVAQEGHSVLSSERLGSRIGSELLQLIDDPLLAAGWSSRPFDDEGCPSRRLQLMGDGIFQHQMHNSKTGRKAGCASSGHASRAIRGTLGIASSNLFLEPGTQPVTALRARYPRAIEVTEIVGLHSGSSLSSGDFSVPCKGFLLEAGERKQALQDFTISGNILETLQRIEALGDDLYFGLSGVGSPAWLVSKLSVGGK